MMTARDENRSSPQRRLTGRLLALLLAALFVASPGCGSGDEVGGIWKSPLNTPMRRYVDGKAIGGPEDYIKVVLGQYGSDVAGVISFYDDQSLQTMRCPCSFISRGRKRGKTVEIVFAACAPDVNHPEEMIAFLQFTEDEVEPLLKGDVFLSRAPEVPYAHLELRGNPTLTVSQDDKRCNPDLKPGAMEGLNAAPYPEPDVQGGADVLAD